MKSYQIELHIPTADRALYSDLKVMQSSAGYYIGTEYNSIYGVTPGSRDSDYYQTREKAQFALTYLENMHRNRSTEECPQMIVETWARQMYIFDCDPRQVGYRFNP